MEVEDEDIAEEDEEFEKTEKEGTKKRKAAKKSTPKPPSKQSTPADTKFEEAKELAEMTLPPPSMITVGFDPVDNPLIWKIEEMNLNKLFLIIRKTPQMTIIIKKQGRTLIQVTITNSLKPEEIIKIGKRFSVPDAMVAS